MTAAAETAQLVDAFSTALQPLVDAMPQSPEWLPTVQAVAAVGTVVAALGSIVALILSGLSLRKASAANRVARSAAMDTELRDLRKLFDDRGYFIRMWFLDQLTRDEPWYSVNVDKPPGTSEEEYTQWKQYEQLWKDALGRDVATERADMFELYHLALRVSAWLDARESDVSQQEAANQINQVIGPHFVPTLLNHRRLACRLKKSGKKGKSETYFPCAYGLDDPRYTDLVHALVSCRPAYGLGPDAGETHASIQEYAISIGLGVDPSACRTDEGLIDAAGDQEEPA